MRWYEASSPEDLKTLGKLKTVKSMINKDIREIIGKQKIDSFIKMGSNSWKGVFDKIQYLKKIGLVVAENNGQSIGCNDKKYFLNESTKYIYYLLELEGETRMRKLNINRTHYRNKEAAKMWYYDIVRKIHPDTNRDARAVEAMAELTSIYNKMIGNG